MKWLWNECEAVTCRLSYTNIWGVSGQHLLRVCALVFHKLMHLNAVDKTRKCAFSSAARSKLYKININVPPCNRLTNLYKKHLCNFNSFVEFSHIILSFYHINTVRKLMISKNICALNNDVTYFSNHSKAFLTIIKWKLSKNWIKTNVRLYLSFFQLNCLFVLF